MYRSSRFGLVCAAALLAAAVGCSKDPEVAKREYLASGDAYAKEGKHREALVEYRNAVQQDATFGEARFKLAETYAQLGDAPNAFREYVRAADLLPEHAEAQLKAGSMLLLAGRYEDAKARAAGLLAREPKNVEAHVLLANATAGLKDVAGAVAEIESAIQMDPSRSASYSNLGMLELVRGDRGKAEAAYRKAVQIDPSSVPAHLALANFFWATSRAADAEASLKTALGLDAQHVLANRAMALLYMATNRAASAEPHLKTVVEVTKDGTARYTLADYYLSVNRTAEAKAILEELSTDERLATQAQLRLAAVEYGGKNTARAHEIVDGVLEKNAKAVQALLLKGRFLMAERKMDEALARFRSAAESDPQSAEAQYLMGQALVADRQSEEAVKAFSEVLRLNPSAVAAQLQLASLHLAAGRADTSLQFAQEASKTAPRSLAARLSLTRSLMASGNLDKAESELRMLEKAAPEAAPVHLQLGALALARKNLPAAAASFARASQLDPSSLEAITGLVVLDLAAGRLTEARARIDARLQQTPRDVNALLLAARTYAAAKDPAAAEGMLRRAIDADPSRLEPYGMLGQLFLAQKKLDLARAEFERAAVQQPDSVPAHTMVATILHTQNQTAEATKRYERILQIDPQATVAANNLAWLYAEQGGNLDMALQLAQTAKARAPESAEISDTLGWVYYKKDMATLAVPAFKLSVEKDPKNASYRYHLGLAYAKTGDVDLARQELDAALKLQPAFEGADEARRVLTTLER